MSYKIEQFGFEYAEEIPVKENDWTQMLTTFMADTEHGIIRRQFDNKSQASNAASAIRKAAAAIGATDVEVVNTDGVVYVQKCVPLYAVREADDAHVTL